MSGTARLVASHGDAVVVAAYLVVLVVGVAAGFGEAESLTATVAAFLAGGVHLLYAGGYFLARPTTAAEHGVRPVTLRFGITGSDRFHRRMTRYDDPEGARRAGVYLVGWGAVVVLFSVGAAAVLPVCCA